MSAHVLHYDRPAREWTEALPVGNGRLGAMVFGGVDVERLQLNEVTLWSGWPHDPGTRLAATGLAEYRALGAPGRSAEAEARSDDTPTAVPVKPAPYWADGSRPLELDGVDPAADSGYRRSLDLDTAEAV